MFDLVNVMKEILQVMKEIRELMKRDFPVNGGAKK